MFTNLNADPSKKPRFLGELGDLSHAKVSSGEFKYRRGAEIFGEQEPAEYIYQVIDGAVRTHKLLADGRRQIGAFHLPGDMFGLVNGDFHRFTAEAIGNTTVRLVKRQSLEREANNDPAMIKSLVKMTTSNLRHVENHLLLLGRQTAQERVGAFLIEMNDRQASADVIKLPMSRRDIADYLGLTIETVSRSLSKFERKGYLKFLGSTQRCRTECRRPDRIRRVSWRTQVGWVAVGLHNCFNYTSLGLQQIPGRVASACRRPGTTGRKPRR